MAKISADADNNKAAGRGGGVEAVIAVLKRADHDAADSLLEKAREALARLVTDSSNLAVTRRLLPVDNFAVYLKSC